MTSTPIIHLILCGIRVCNEPGGGGVSPGMLNDVNCSSCISSEAYATLKKGYAIIYRRPSSS